MRALWALIAAGVLIASSTAAEEVGSFTNDWSGNEIVVEAIEDPKIKGITCHLSHFERGLIDRLRKGNWFEDPSNASIACARPVQS
jgi:CreA protein